MSSKPEIVVRCPACGSDDIRGIHEAIAHLPVYSWQRDADGNLIPDGMGEDDNIEWEWTDAEKQFVCCGITAPHGRRCDARYGLDELTVSEEPTNVR